MSFHAFHLGVREQPVNARTGLLENRRLAAIVVIVFLAGLTLFYLYDVRLRANPAFTEAMNLLSHSTQAKAALGDPIKAEFGVRGVIQNSVSAGYAILKAPVAGPMRKGTIYVVANRAANGWNIEGEVLQIGTGSEKIDLSPPTPQEFFHYPATGHLYLLPLDDTAASDLSGLPAYFKARLGLDVHLLPTQQLTPDTFSTSTNQVIAEKIVMSIKEKQPVMAEDVNAEILGVTSQDMNYQSMNLSYGTNLRSGRFSVVSTARLHRMPWYAGDNPEAFAVRTRKLVTRNLALLHYPVDVSSDVTSGLSSDVYTASEVDQMGESFGGESGKAGLVSPGAPCVNIHQSPSGNQSWRVDCYGDYRLDSPFEGFETFTGVPLFVLSRADFFFRGQPFFPFIREYRPQDDRSRPFGIGASDSFDIFPVGDSQTFAWIELILAGGERTSLPQDFHRYRVDECRISREQILREPVQLIHSAVEWERLGPCDERRLDLHIPIERTRTNLAARRTDRIAFALRQHIFTSEERHKRSASSAHAGRRIPRTQV